MSRKSRFLLALAILAGVLGFRAWQHQAQQKKAGPHAPVAAEPAPERKLGRIAFRPCTLTPPIGASVEAQCGTFAVAENPALPNGRRIALNIAWLPSDDSGDHLPDPVFMSAYRRCASVKSSR